MGPSRDQHMRAVWRIQWDPAQCQVDHEASHWSYSSHYHYQGQYCIPSWLYVNNLLLFYFSHSCDDQIPSLIYKPEQIAAFKLNTHTYLKHGEFPLCILTIIYRLYTLKHELYPSDYNGDFVAPRGYLKSGLFILWIGLQQWAFPGDEFRLPHGNEKGIWVWFMLWFIY